MSKLLLFANTDWYLYNFRLALAKELRAQGHDVVLLSPPGKFHERLQANGFEWLPFSLSRQGINPFQELGSIVRLARLYKVLQPDLVHHHTIKCVIYGSLAARAAGVPGIINSVTGRGFVFSSTQPLARLLQPLVRLMYKLTWSTPKINVIFENQTDMNFFLESRLIPKEQSSLIPGVGVDINRYRPAPTPNPDTIVLLATRMLWDKGVGSFVEAARIVREEINNVRFVLVGDIDNGNPASLDKLTLQQWHEEGIIEWWGFRDNMPSIYSSSNIVCFPTVYGEGVPTVLLEASASGLPIVATDVPGCREVVRHGVNGFLVPPRDPQALARALKRLLSDPGLRKKMGTAGRQIVLEHFSLEQIIYHTLEVYRRALMQQK